MRVLTEAQNSEGAQADGEVVPARAELRKGRDVGPDHGRLRRVEYPSICEAVLQGRVGSTVDENLARIEDRGCKVSTRGRDTRR